MAYEQLQALITCLLCTSAALATAATQYRQHQLLAPVDPPSKLYARMAGLVVPYNYPLEEHFVRTVDGYILRLFRIPHGSRAPSADQPANPTAQQHPHSTVKQSAAAWLPWLWRSRPSESKIAPAAAAVAERVRPVVHMQHGLLGSSTDFLLNGPGLSLPLLLADAGYDVWFGNVRGNIFSRNHTSLDLFDAAFWDFSWDEMAARDLPAMITHELLVTGAAEVSYIGHSQGTTIGLAFLASHSNTALAERIKVAVLLAPVAFVTHVDSIPLRTLATLNTDEIFTLLGIHEFLPSSEIMSKLEGQLCKFQPALCVNLLAAICGYNPNNLDTRRLPTYLNYTPSGTSVKNMAHWSQAVRQPGHQTMSFFDYGTSCRTLLDLPRPCNQAVYGHLVPPTYNLSDINTPLALFTGGKDRLADPLDTELMLEALPVKHILLRHDEPEYEHLDVIWGINAASRIYTKVLSILGDLHLEAPAAVRHNAHSV